MARSFFGHYCGDEGFAQTVVERRFLAPFCVHENPWVPQLPSNQQIKGIEVLVGGMHVNIWCVKA